MAEKQKESRRRGRAVFKLAVPAALAVFLTVVYIADPASDYAFGTTEPISLSEDAAGVELTDSLYAPQVVDEQNGVRLSVSQGGVVSVEDAGGVCWSNALAVDDSNETHLEDSLVRSPFSLTYKYDREKDVTLTAYTDAVEKEQYRVSVDGKKIVTEYVLGECGGAILPAGIPEERMQQDILPKLSEEDADYLLRRYSWSDRKELSENMLAVIRASCPGIDQVSFYYLSDGASASKQRRVAELLEQAGYTQEQYQQDCRITGEQAAEYREAYRVVVEYSLQNGDLVIHIPFEEIHFHPDNPLVTLDFSRLLGYAANGEEGYYLIPAANGITVPLGGYASETWRYPFYGSDCTKDAGDTVDSAVPFPVFGMVRGAGGYLAVVEEGAEVSTLVMETSVGYSELYLSLSVLDYGNTSITESKTSTVYAQSGYTGDVRIRFHLLSGEQASYSGMAACYRQYLIEQGLLRPADTAVPEVLIEWIGNVVGSRISPMLPIEQPICLTTLEQCRSACGELEQAGIGRYALKLSGFNKGGLFAQVPGSYAWESRLGSRSDWNAFLSQEQEKGHTLYLSTDFGFYYNDRFGDGFSQHRYSARAINNSFAVNHVISKANGTASSMAKPIQILSSKNFLRIAQRYHQELEVGWGLSLGDSTAHINSDFDTENYIGRPKAAAQLQEAVAVLAGERKVALSSPAAYLLAQAALTETAAANTAEGAPGYTAVPFVQMVLHGSLPYASAPINMSADPAYSVLQAIETGSIPQYRLAGELDARVMETEYSYLYSIDYAHWKTAMIESVAHIREALRGLEQQTITTHDIRGELRRIGYSDGTVLYVNYGGQAQDWDGVPVPAAGYRRVEAG